MHLGQSAHDGQADAEASLRAIERLVDLREQFEDARQHFRRNADPVVLNFEYRLTV